MDYYINVNMALALIYGFYHLALTRSVYFSVNRAFLLCGLALAFIIPALSLKLGGFSGIPASLYTPEISLEPASSSRVAAAAPVPLSPVPIVAAQPAASALTLKEWVTIIYCCISGLFLLKIFLFLYQVLQLYRKKLVLKRDGYWLVLLENAKEPAFSFFSIVFINSTDLQRSDNWILRHELVHVKQVHSLDILLSEIVKALLWINPFVYLYQRAIRSVNEYAADAIVPREEKGRYARLMYDYSFRSRALSLQNSFYNKNLLKRRITMLYQKKTWKMKAAYLLVVPLVGLLLAFTSREAKESPNPVPAEVQNLTNGTPARAPGVITQASDVTAPAPNVTAPAPSETLAAVETITVTGTVTDIMNRTIAGASIFVKGTQHGTATDLEGHFELRNIPSDAQLQFSMIGYETELVTLQNNSTVNIRLQRKRERLEGLIIRAYSSKEDESEKKEGPEKKNATRSEPSQEPEGPVYQFASLEKMPSFPGGHEMLVRHIAKRFRYPAKARENNVEGVIEIGFIVDKKGNVTQPEILKGIGSGCDEEALRVVKTLPQWEPGQQNGAKVAVYYVVPLNLDVE